MEFKNDISVRPPPSNSIFKRVGMVLTSPDWTQPKQWLKRSFPWPEIHALPLQWASLRMYINMCMCVCARLHAPMGASPCINAQQRASRYIICLPLALLSQITSWPTECNLHSSWHRAGVWSMSLRTSDSCEFLAFPLSWWHRESTCFPWQVWGHIINGRPLQGLSQCVDVKV